MEGGNAAMQFDFDNLDLDELSKEIKAAKKKKKAEKKKQQSAPPQEQSTFYPGQLELMDMGFTELEAQEALEKFGGSFDDALPWLLAGRPSLAHTVEIRSEGGVETAQYLPPSQAAFYSQIAQTMLVPPEHRGVLYKRGLFRPNKWRPKYFYIDPEHALRFFYMGIPIDEKHFNEKKNCYNKNIDVRKVACISGDDPIENLPPGKVQCGITIHFRKEDDAHPPMELFAATKEEKELWMFALSAWHQSHLNRERVESEERIAEQERVEATTQPPQQKPLERGSTPKKSRKPSATPSTLSPTASSKPMAGAGVNSTPSPTAASTTSPTNKLRATPSSTTTPKSPSSRRAPSASSALPSAAQSLQLGAPDPPSYYDDEMPSPAPLARAPRATSTQPQMPFRAI